MRILLIISSLVILTLAGCGSQNDVEVPVTREPEVPKTPSSLSTPLPDAPVNIPLNLNGLNTVGQPGGAGLNPAHGKPGHRCDIAVGAPLNSSVSANTAQPITVPSQPSNPVIQASPAGALNASAPAASATGLNPEHGKPGHRCDIAVGAPLNSNPTSAATTTIKTAAPAAPTVKPGMNPQHGQPGHRCDIAVGAPLNSKPLPAVTPAAKTPDLEVKKDSSGGE